MHAKISIFGILQLFVDHRNAYFDALKKIEEDVDTIIANFIELVTNLDTDLTCNMLCFQDNKLPNEDVIKKKKIRNVYLHAC